MTVYVDDAFIQATVPNGRARHASRWCHLTATSKEELHAFAARLGLRRSYFQSASTRLWHYDITKSKRAQAIRLGAVPITGRQMIHMINERDGLPPLMSAAEDGWPLNTPGRT